MSEKILPRSEFETETDFAADLPNFIRAKFGKMLGDKIDLLEGEMGLARLQAALWGKDVRSMNKTRRRTPSVRIKRAA